MHNFFIMFTVKLEICFWFFFFCNVEPVNLCSKFFQKGIGDRNPFHEVPCASTQCLHQFLSAYNSSHVFFSFVLKMFFFQNFTYSLPDEQAKCSCKLLSQGDVRLTAVCWWSRVLEYFNSTLCIA